MHSFVSAVMAAFLMVVCLVGTIVVGEELSHRSSPAQQQLAAAEAFSGVRALRAAAASNNIPLTRALLKPLVRGRVVSSVDVDYVVAQEALLKGAPHAQLQRIAQALAAGVRGLGAQDGPAAARAYAPQVLYGIEHAAGVALDPLAQSYARHQARLHAQRTARMRGLLELAALGLVLAACAFGASTQLRRRAIFVESALSLGA